MALRDRPPGRGAYGYRELLVFFLPLAASSLVQGFRGPILDAGMSRGNFPIDSLATFAVISSVMMMPATSANSLQSLFLVFVRGMSSYDRVRRFTIWFAIVVMALTAVLAIPGVGDFIFLDVMGAPPEINVFLRPALLVMLLFPIAMIARAYFQSILVLQRSTRPVWLASTIGIMALFAISFGVTPFVSMRASTVAALAQVVVAGIEAAVLWLVVRHTLAENPLRPDSDDTQVPSTGRLLQFLWPLLITQMLMAGTTPLVSAGILRLDDGEIALAGYRVAWSLAVIGFGAIVMLRQTTLVMSRDPADHRRGRIFSVAAGATVTALLLLASLGPAGDFVLNTLIGSPPEVSAVALPAWRILAFLPLLGSLRQFYTSLLLNRGKSRSASVGSLIRVAAVAVTLFYLAPGIAMAGATLGALARVGGGVIETAVSTAIGRRYYGRFAPPAKPDRRSEEQE